jgi:hypothetical protein
MIIVIIISRVTLVIKMVTRWMNGIRISGRVSSNISSPLGPIVYRSNWFIT